MSTDPADNSNQDPDAMRDQLRKDVASWSANRSGIAARDTEEFRVPTPVRAAPQPKKAKAAAAPVAAPAPVAKKPFSMSYDGVTTAQHIQYRIDRGAR